MSMFPNIWDCFSARVLLCWFSLALTIQTLGSRDAHVKSSLPPRCRLAISTGYHWDRSKLSKIVLIHGIL